MPKVFLSLLAAASMAVLAGCGGGWYVSGTTGGYYAYDYYPDWDVYYYPNAGRYYWYDGGHWRWGRRLPPRFHVNPGASVHLQLHSRQPWREYHEARPEFREHYRGWR
ncbi:MAG TPA: hypothetical protein VN873_09910 [Candidatus Angelobacter sp.]|nr:hypothetical protein [Candidatus Angelobacter sp.]